MKLSCTCKSVYHTLQVSETMVTALGQVNVVTAAPVAPGVTPTGVPVGPGVASTGVPVGPSIAAPGVCVGPTTTAASPAVHGVAGAMNPPHHHQWGHRQLQEWQPIQERTSHQFHRPLLVMHHRLQRRQRLQRLFVAFVPLFVGFCS